MIISLDTTFRVWDADNDCFIYQTFRELLTGTDTEFSHLVFFGGGKPEIVRADQNEV